MLKGPNGEQVKLNQSEVNEEDELQKVKNTVSSFIQIDQANYLRHKICLILQKTNMTLQST